jgi:phosphohistidine phosphatase
LTHKPEFLKSMTTTELYIIRHGLAGEHGSYADDAQRPLTDEGHRKMGQVAQRFYALDLRFDLILTSPLVRARQTAEILQAAGLSKHLEVSEFLAPGGDFEDWLAWFRQWQSSESLAIVGHEPSLSQWAERLIWGEVRQRLLLKKAGAIGLKVPNGEAIGQSQLFWLTPPKLLL